MSVKIQKVEQAILRLPQMKSFGVIGDPGCDGLGTYNMKVYAGALEESARDDITLVLGDLVPVGNKLYYDVICSMTEEIAGNDVYVLRGNHDTGEYRNYFGRQNYALLSGALAVVVIDNALRSFEDEGLELLRSVLALPEVEQAVVAFHIPVPNRFIRNSVSEEQFSRLKEAYRSNKDKVKYFLCGHVHSRFVDVTDGIPLVCTGGGGAMIEDVSAEIRASDVNHHMVHFALEEGKLSYRFTDLSEDGYNRERKDEILRKQLVASVKDELLAHLKYLMFADRARRRGFPNLANLFQALAESEYHHARNFYSVLERPAAFAESIAAFIPGETFEYEKLYAALEQYCKDGKFPLARQAYGAAGEAERIHAQLLTAAADMDGFQEEKFYVCPICGFVMAGDAPERCPVCGSPKQQFTEYAER